MAIRKPWEYWSFAYARARIRNKLYQWSYPDSPWLTSHAVREIDGFLQPQYRVCEWGAGRSTIWFAKRAGLVVSIEHDMTWHSRVSLQLERQGLRNVDLRLLAESDRVYVDPFDWDAAFDLVLVDGRRREECIGCAIKRVRPGGWLVLDDAERHLPLIDRPQNLPLTPPDLIAREVGKCAPGWEQVYRSLSGWNQLWTSDGISDTVIWRCPAKRS